MAIKKFPFHLQMLPEIGEHLALRSRGKVRDTYELSNSLMLVVVTDRCSIFDFILGHPVPLKGEVLNSIDLFFRLFVLKDFQHHLVAFGTGIDKYLPIPLRGNKELYLRATVVRKLDMVPAEGIVRRVLTGSAVKPYKETGMVCGIKLPEGLEDGDMLPEPIFTPTTKAEEGHDEHIDAASIDPLFAEMMTRMAVAGARYLATRNILLVDTKGEGSIDVLGDEVLTPDSSRYVSLSEYQARRARGEKGLPSSMDKQYTREVGKGYGIDKLDPTKPEDVENVFGIRFTEDEINHQSRIYADTFCKVTGMPLWDFQKRYLLGQEKRHIEIVVGSRSDLRQMELGLKYLSTFPEISLNVSVISCHRNPKELREYACKLSKTDKFVIVIAGAGMHAALPGVLKAHLVSLQTLDIPVIGVAFSGKTEKLSLAATTSMECLPENPVELIDGENAFFGSAGFLKACEAAVSGFFPPRGFTKKDPEFNIISKALGETSLAQE